MITTNKGLIAIVLGLGFVVAMGFGALITVLIIKAKDPIPSIPGTNFTDKLVSEQFIVNPEEKININPEKFFSFINPNLEDINIMCSFGKDELHFATDFYREIINRFKTIKNIRLNLIKFQ